MRGALLKVADWVKAVFEPLIIRLVQVGVVPSAVVLAAQTFMALFPLLIALIAIAPTSVGTSIAETLRSKLGLHGSADDSVRQLINTHNQLRGWVTVIGILVVLGSATSFTRALQRTYEAAWQLPKLGLRGSLRGLVWLVGIVAYIALATVAVKLTAGLGPAASGLRWTFSVATTFLIWWWTPFLLLGGRVRARALVPGALLTAAGLVVLGWVANLYLPRAIGTQESRYGTIGAVFAIQSWLVVVAGAIVLAAVFGAVGAQYRGPIGRLLRGTRDPEGWHRTPGYHLDRRSPEDLSPVRSRRPARRRTR